MLKMNKASLVDYKLTHFCALEKADIWSVLILFDCILHTSTHIFRDLDSQCNNLLLP